MVMHATVVIVALGVSLAAPGFFALRTLTHGSRNRRGHRRHAYAPAISACRKQPPDNGAICAAQGGGRSLWAGTRAPKFR